MLKAPTRTTFPPFKPFLSTLLAMSGYSEVKESDEFSSEDTFSTSPSRERRRWGFVFRLLLQSTIVCSLCLASFFIGAGNAKRPNEVACVDTAWDKVREGISFKTHEFSPRFGGRPSPYMGHPNTGVDKLWYHLAALRNFGVPKEVLVFINRTRGAVKLPGNDGYMAGMEAFHQLHCLNYIRMYTYMDYYEKIDTDIKAETMEERREHADHCVETLPSPASDV
ncbi:protein of unknown function (DUF3328) domain containing protein [Rhypophila sp. PSN 637]